MQVFFYARLFPKDQKYLKLVVSSTCTMWKICLTRSSRFNSSGREARGNYRFRDAHTVAGSPTWSILSWHSPWIGKPSPHMYIMELISKASIVYLGEWLLSEGVGRMNITPRALIGAVILAVGMMNMNARSRANAYPGTGHSDCLQVSLTPTCISSEYEDCRQLLHLQTISPYVPLVELNHSTDGRTNV